MRAFLIIRSPLSSPEICQTFLCQICVLALHVRSKHKEEEEKRNKIICGQLYLSFTVHDFFRLRDLYSWGQVLEDCAHFTKSGGKLGMWWSADAGMVYSLTLKVFQPANYRSACAQKPRNYRHVTHSQSNHCQTFWSTELRMHRVHHQVRKGGSVPMCVQARSCKKYHVLRRLESKCDDGRGQVRNSVLKLERIPSARRMLGNSPSIA